MIAILRCQQRIAFMNQLNALSNRVEYYGLRLYFCQQITIEIESADPRRRDMKS